jgi:hypothetical protein
MAFTSFKSLEQVLTACNLSYKEQICGYPLQYVAPKSLHEEINFNISEIHYKVSENAICESVLFPILKAVWLQYKDIFAIFSHPMLELDDIFTGYPDYVLAKKSARGKIFLEQPYLAVVEAKKDDFSAGWGQCGAEMYALQQLNHNKAMKIMGIVSNGDVWQFAFLEGQVFWQCSNTYTIQQLDLIFNFMTSYLVEIINS